MAAFRRVLLLMLILFLFPFIIGGCGDDDEVETAAEPEAEEATVPPPKTDVIVFIRDGEVWAVNPNNGAERQVTDDGADKYWPRLSPDGETVLYQAAGDDGESGGIHIVPLAEGGEEPEQLRDSGRSPCWSTNGEQIAFIVSTILSDGSEVDDIAVIDAADPGTGEDILTDHANVDDMGGKLAIQYLAYSPDGGAYIYFMRGRRSDSRWLARLDVETGVEENLETPPGAMPEALAEGGFSLFNVSQMEGRRALVSRGDFSQGNYQGDFKLYICFLEPALEDSMIEESPGSINPSLKPDNTRFVYENDGILYKHNLAGGPGIEVITDGSMPDWGSSAVGPGVGAGDDTGTGTGTTGTTGSDDSDGADTQGNTAGGYIKNGDFMAGLESWQVVDIKKKGTNSAVVADDPEYGKVLVLGRVDSQNDGGLIGVEQELDVDVSGLDSLELSLVAAIDGQTLNSDGWYDGETPVFVTIDYTNGSGEPRSWTHGFMVSGSVINYPGRDENIPPIDWHTYDSGNLLPSLTGAVTIDKVTVAGSGWDLFSRIAEVSLMGS